MPLPAIVVIAVTSFTSTYVDDIETNLACNRKDNDIRPRSCLKGALRWADNQLLTCLNADVNLNLVKHSGRNSNNVNVYDIDHGDHINQQLGEYRFPRAVVGGVSRPR